MQGWEMNNKTRQTYFTSDFYDFTNDNENSKIEDFDISQQYLKSELSQKSIILKELNQQYFLKTLEIYDKVCLYDSLYSWRKINEKQKFQQKRNPNNMTKVFLKVFYLLNKKIRTKIQKSFVKMHNFTKHNDMKTYETPLVKGIKKLDETFKTMDQKYFYNHPIKSQQLINQAFKELIFRVRTLKNRNQIGTMFNLINKMTSYISLKQFHQILGQWQRLLQKIDIFVGSLNLFVNPIKRNAFQKIKKINLDQKVSLFYKRDSQDSIFKKNQRIKSDQFDHLETQNYEHILDDEINQKQGLIEKQKIFWIDQTNNLLVNEQNDTEKTPTKHSLNFSKDLRRKGSNEKKKNKLKFKNIPGNSPDAKKSKQPRLSAQSIQNYENFSKTEKVSNQQREQLKLCVNVQKINLTQAINNLKVHHICISFQNSLTFESKSSRNISIKEQSIKLNTLRPHQLNSSFPDYFDISSYSDMPVSLTKIIKQKNQFLKEQNQKSPSKAFKTTISGKSISFQQQKIQKVRNNPIDSSPLKTSLKGLNFYTQNNLGRRTQPGKQQKFLSDAYRFNTAQNQPVTKKNTKQILKDSRKEKSDKNLPSKTQRYNRNSQLLDKHQYLFPLSKGKNSQLGIISKLASKIKRDDYYIISEYQSHPFRASVQKCQKALSSNKSSLQKGKIGLLSFNTNRPMKKIKSAGKDSISKIKSPQNKKQNKQKQKIIKSKKAKQIKSQYYDSRNQSLHLHSHKNRQQDFTTISMKSAKSNSLEKPIIKSVSSKVMKKQK